MGYSTVRRIMREGLTDPRNLDGIALWNSTRDVTDLTTDTGIKLWADKSGNSGVNCLVTNGATGNYASTTKLIPTGSFRLEFFGSLPDWTPVASASAFMGVYAFSTNNRSWRLELLSTGVIQLRLSSDGTAGTVQSIASTAANSFTDHSEGGVAVDVNLVAGTADFSTSTNGTTWAALGTQVSFTPLTLFDATASLEVGAVFGGTDTPLAANVRWARIYQTSVLTKNCEPRLAAKLATSFVAPTTGETWTINTSGATGARISGARDLYQGTAANQPILTIAAAGNYLTFDGSNDYLKAAAFALAQPETVYFVGSQVTHAGNDTLYDGNAADTMRLLQAVSPYCTVFAGTTGVSGSGLGYALATQQIYSAIYNGASSVNRVNRNTAGTGQAGAGNANGFLLGAYNNGASGWANITAQEVLVYSTAQDENYQYRVTRLLSRRTGVLVV